MNDDELQQYWSRRSQRWAKIYRWLGYSAMVLAIILSFFLWLWGEWVRNEVLKYMGWR